MNNSPNDRINALTEELNRYRHEYYNLNAPSVSDEVYDRLYDDLAGLEQTYGYRMSNSPTQTVGYPVVSKLVKTRHPIPLLSLEKTKLTDDLLKFIGNRAVMAMLKLDGLTIKLEYDYGYLMQASTRGDGDEGEDITHNICAISGVPAEIPYKGRLVVVGEAYITDSDFEILKCTLTDSNGEPYSNSRNLAAGSVRCLDAAVCAERRVRFTPFNVQEGLDDIQFEVPDSKEAKLTYLEGLGFISCDRCLITETDKTQLEDIIEALRKVAKSNGIPIDGIVVKYDSIEYSRSCGRTGHHYKDGLAFKFEDELHETVHRSIEWNPSRTGEITPVAIFDTKVIGGCEVSRALLHNLTAIKELELMPGCRVLVSKRNDVIPKLEKNLDRGGFDAAAVFPSVCPCCGEPTRIQESKKDKNRIVETLWCDNPDCAAKRLKQFVHFTEKKAMDIEGLSEATLEKFIGRGWLHSFTDIYRLDRYMAEIISMEGFGEKSYANLWDAIQKSRNTTFERFVIAMDISMIGNTASRELCKTFDGDLDTFTDVVYMGYNFMQLPDFGETLHKNIHEWFRESENLKLWKELKTIVTIEKKETISAEVGNNPFFGKTVVVTGTLVQFTRDSIKTKIESLGAKSGESVSKNTDYVLYGDKAGSKLDKAKSLEITILTEQQFLEMIGE